MKKRNLIGLLLVVLALLAAIPAYAQIEIDPDALPAWEKVTLSQRMAFDIPDFGDLTVYYPDGWAVDQSESGFGNVNVANSPELLEVLDSADGLEAGQLAGVLFGVTDDQLESLDIADEPAVGTLLPAMLDDLLGEDDDIRFETPQPIVLNDQRAVVAAGTGVAEGGETVDLLAFATEPDGKLVFSLFILSLEDVDQFAVAEVFAIVASMRVNAGETGDGDTDGTRDVEIEQFDTITASSPDIGTLTVSYPADYLASDEGDGSFSITNSQDVLDSFGESGGPTSDKIESGQFGMVGIGFPSELATFLGIEADSELSDALMGLVTMVLDSDGGIVFELDEPEVVEFGVNSGAIVTGRVTEDDVTNDAGFVLLQMDGGYVLLMCIAAEDEIGDYDAIIRAIAASVEYAPPEEE